MATIGRDAAGRPVIAGAGVLPPMEPDGARPLPTSTNGKPATEKTPKQTATRDRFATLNAFVDCSMAELSKSDLATWLILYRDTKKGTACTSQTDIARRAGLSVRAVRYAVKRLVAAGLLTVVFQGGLRRGTTRFRVEPLRKLVAAGKRQNGVNY